MPSTSATTAVSRTLERAAEVVGGVDVLAIRLSSPAPEVTRWIEGVPPPPETRVFIAALNIVTAGR